MNATVIQFVDGPVGQIETASLLCDLAQPMPAQALLLLHPHRNPESSLHQAICACPSVPVSSAPHGRLSCRGQPLSHL